jgi:hypothetical protein
VENSHKITQKENTKALMLEFLYSLWISLFAFILSIIQPPSQQTPAVTEQSTSTTSEPPQIDVNNLAVDEEIEPSQKLEVEHTTVHVIDEQQQQQQQHFYNWN